MNIWLYYHMYRLSKSLFLVQLIKTNRENNNIYLSIIKYSKHISFVCLWYQILNSRPCAFWAAALMWALLHPFSSGHFGDRISLFVGGQPRSWVCYFKFPVITGMTDVNHHAQFFQLRWGLLNFLMGQVWIHDPCLFSLPSRWDSRHATLVPG